MDDDRGERLGDGLEDVRRLRTSLVYAAGGNPGHDGAAQPFQEPRDDLRDQMSLRVNIQGSTWFGEVCSSCS